LLILLAVIFDNKFILAKRDMAKIVPNEIIGKMIVFKI